MLRKERGDVCNVTVGPCNQTSGFCDCNGDGVLNYGEPSFDCGDPELKTKGVMCATYCQDTVCKFTFYSTDTCDTPDDYKFSIYGAPVGDITSMWLYHHWYKSNNLSFDAYMKWNAVHVNLHGCSLDVFPDSLCEDGDHDQFITTESLATYHGNRSVNFSKVGGNCTPLAMHPRCVYANKPCLHPPPTPKPTPFPPTPPTYPPTPEPTVEPTPEPTVTTTTEIPFKLQNRTCYPRKPNEAAGKPPADAKLATIAQLDKECEKPEFGVNCEYYPDMQPNDECNAADGMYFGRVGDEPPSQLAKDEVAAEETSCYMSDPGICDGEGCLKCDQNCTYTVFEDYKCGGAVQEHINEKGDSILMHANKTGSVAIHGKGCAITFYENHDKSGQQSTYSSDTPGIQSLGDCNYCVKYACDYLKDDAETLVTTEATADCR